MSLENGAALAGEGEEVKVKEGVRKIQDGIESKMVKEYSG
jgi:hypothetical protein